MNKSPRGMNRGDLSSAGRTKVYSSEVEAVRIHHLGPGRDEVFNELLLLVGGGVDLGEGTELRMRAEDQVDAGAGPFDLVRLPVTPFIHAVGA